MAMVEDRSIHIREISKNLGNEIIVELSNGLTFKSQYNLCKNLTVNFLFSPDGDLLSVLELDNPGNHTQAQMEKIEDIMNSDESIEVIRDRALKHSFSSCMSN